MIPRRQSKFWRTPEVHGLAEKVGRSAQSYEIPEFQLEGMLRELHVRAGCCCSPLGRRSACKTVAVGVCMCRIRNQGCKVEFVCDACVSCVAVRTQRNMSVAFSRLERFLATAPAAGACKGSYYSY